VSATAPANAAGPRPRGELAQALRACRSAIVGIVLASALINVLYLSGSLYMLEV
jgi:ABC-type protease/lipase transport system fused ATPase/permease subunit